MVSPTSLLQLSVEVDGEPWRADRDLFGAVNPSGVDRSVLMAGSFGPKDADEQVFSLHVFGAAGPGRYRVHSGDAGSGVAQLANLSQARYLIGNVLGYDLQVDVIEMRASPVRIEARFEGNMTASDGAVLTVANGVYRYRE